MTDPRFLLVGFASELSLRPLEQVLRARGLQVATVDLSRAALTDAAVPDGDGPLVLVSSQHFAMTGTAHDQYVGSRSSYAAPQALREQVDADLLVYMPHDLLDVLLPAEVPALSVFDLFAAPDDDHWWAASLVPTVNVGWVGHAVTPAPPPADTPLAHGVLFTTGESWVHDQGGGEFLLRSLRHTLATGIAVRLARWPGVESLAAPLRRAGVPIIEPDIPATALIAHSPLVVTNAPSSVLAEACVLGHRPICVSDPSGDELFAGHLDCLDVLVCRDREFAELRSEAGRVASDAVRFDVDAFLGAVDAQLRMRRRATP